MKKYKNARIYHLLLLSAFIALLNSCSKDDVNPVTEYYSAIAAGYGHSMALEPDGTLWTWGNNYSGQLGDGTNQPKNKPLRVGPDYMAISAGGFSYSAGYYEFEEAGFSLGLKRDGSLWAWGCNFYGQLGDTSFLSKNVPVRIGSEFVKISAGGEHALALKDDQTLWAWGNNSSHQVGDGTEVKKNVPVNIGSGYVAISAGGYHSLALKADNSLWAWGNNGYGQLGDGTLASKNIPVKIGSDYIAISAGYNHSLGLKTDGTLWSWGYNADGELGDGSNLERQTPMQIGSGFSAISAGGNMSFAIDPHGNLWGWGENIYGQLGDGTSIDKNTPVLIGDGFLTISAGGASYFFGHALAIKKDGSLWAWGSNYHGQLGYGPGDNKNTPVQIGGN